MSGLAGRLAAATLATVLGQRLRSSLAVLGLVVGVAAVVLMVALGEASRNRVLGQITSMGSNLISVRAAKTSLTGGREKSASQVSTMTPADATAITRLAGVAAAVPLVQSALTISYSQVTVYSQVIAATPEIFSLEEQSLVQGRFFSSHEEKSSRRVAVVGNTLRRNLAGEGSLIGKFIEIKKQPFMVIGELAPKGADPFGNDLDDRAYIPLKTALRRLLGGQRWVDLVNVQADGPDQIAELQKGISELLRSRHRLAGTNKPDDFNIQSQLDLLQARDESSQLFTVLITGIAAISLVVAGVGIMAVMLISVRERTAEIGLRRAVGARRRDIMLQFLMEAVLLGLGGGLLGAFLGLGLAYAVRILGQLAFALPWATAGLAVGVSALVAVLFGLAPARRASRLNPVQALTRV